MLSNKLHRFSFRLSSLIRQQTNIAKDNQNHEPSSEKIIRDQHLSNITVTSFYCQNAIEQLALKVSSNIFFHRNKTLFLQFSNQFVFHH
jgi:hypothetical protein